MTHAAFAQKRNFLITAFLLGISCCNLTFLSWCAPYLRDGHQDFVIYYTAGRILHDGKSAALYDPSLQDEVQRSFTHVPRRLHAIPYNHPPFEALLFVPFTLLKFFPAYLLWTAVNLIMLAVSVLVLRRFPKIGGLPPAQIGLGCAAFFPIVIGMIQGQDIFLLLLLMVLALTCLDQGYDEAAGAWLAGGLFRPHMVIPLVILLAVRRWRVLLGFAPVAVALAGISVMIMGWRWPFAYLDFVLRVERDRSGSFGPQQVPNLRGLITDLPGLHAGGPLVVLLIAAVSLTVLGVALRRMRYGHDSMSYYFCLGIATTILISFHALWYDFTLLLPQVLFLLASLRTAEAREFLSARLLLLFFLFLSPLYMYLEMNVDRIFLIGLILLGLFFRLMLTPAPAAEPA